MPGIKKTMDEFKAGTLRSSSGQLVKDRDQAVAIGLSEERAAGNPVPGPSKKGKHPLKGHGTRVAKP